MKRMNLKLRNGIAVLSLFLATMASAQPAGGFGGVQVQSSLETSQVWKDVNYVGDGNVYHTCDIYLPKQQKKAYMFIIKICMKNIMEMSG